MSWTPTDEQVEKATEALLNQTGHSMYDTTGADFLVRAYDESVDEYRHTARAVLVAVGPHIAKQAQREAAEGMREYIGRDASTPYTQGWNRALEVVSDQIEKEAR